MRELLRGEPEGPQDPGPSAARAPLLKSESAARRYSCLAPATISYPGMQACRAGGPHLEVARCHLLVGGVGEVDKHGGQVAVALQVGG